MHFPMVIVDHPDGHDREEQCDGPLEGDHDTLTSISPFCHGRFLVFLAETICHGVDVRVSET